MDGFEILQSSASGGLLLNDRVESACHSERSEESKIFMKYDEICWC